MKKVQRNSEKIKSTKTLNKNKTKEDIDKTPTSYFKLIKELEKEEKNKKLTQDLKQKEDNKKKPININQSIYSKYSKNLENYLNQNQEDLNLYGSSKYDSLPVSNYLKEMDNHKDRVMNRNFKEPNPKEKDLKDSKIIKILNNHVNCRDKVDLTPMAENEKERNEMKNLEKKNFDEAERTAVVMRRMEYTNLLNKRADFDEDEKNKEMIDNLTKSQEIIRKFWKKFKRRQKLNEINKKKINKNRKILFEIYSKR